MEVHVAINGLYVECLKGFHSLGSQLSDDGSYYIGFYKL
jgi:hypothetical protein